MELQQPEVQGSGAAPWKSNISVDDTLVALHRGGTGGGVLCFEADKMKKKNDNNNNVACKYKRSSEEAQGDSNSSSSPSILLVWSGQPNEDDDDNQPRKLHKPSNCTSFIINKDEGEGPNDGVVGWPPVKTWRKKLFYQHYYAPQQPHMNPRRRFQEQRKWNIKHVLEN